MTWTRKDGEALAGLARHGVAYNHYGKDRWRRLGRKFLKELAAELELTPGTFDLRFCAGGPAVSGEPTLHGERLYVNLHDERYGDFGFYRLCKGRKDYTGGLNRPVPTWAFEDLPRFAAAVREVLDFGENVPRGRYGTFAERAPDLYGAIRAAIGRTPTGA